MFARTQRLTLRPFWLEDADAIVQAIAHQDVVTKLSRAPWPYTIDDARDWLSRAPGQQDVALGVFAHEGAPKPRLIGCIGIHPEDGGHELGYWLTPSAWGRGYATEAGRAMLGIARHAMGLKRLRAGYFSDNPPSGRVLTKLGFRPTGRVEPQFSRARGQEVSCVKMALDLSAQNDTDEPHRMAA